MQEDLRRQRRNLIVMSLLLIFMKCGGMTINKKSVFGAEIVLSNVSVVYIFIWLIWGYFLIRYYQYFMQKGFAETNKVFKDMINKRCMPKIDELVRASHPNIANLEGEMRYCILEKISWTNRLFSGSMWVNYDPKPGKVSQKRIEVPINISAVWKEIIISIFRVLVNHTVATDYLLPLFLALFTVIYCNYSDWQGNIFKIFFSK